MKRASNHTIIGGYGMLTLLNKQIETGLLNDYDLFPAELEERGACYIVRFETRGKEFISMARIIQVSAAKAKLPQLVREVGMKVPKS